MVDNNPPEMSKRQVAFKVRISDILNNPYRKEEGWLPNYVAVGSTKVSRANIIGVIVSKSAGENPDSENFVMDDGTGRVPLRFFRPDDAIEVGDVVLLIGRPREFGGERYVVPEVLRRVKDPKWVEVRKLELASVKHHSVAAPQQQYPVPDAPRADQDSDDLLVETEDFSTNPQTRVLDTIRSLDSGAGVSFEEISVKSGVDGAEAYVKRLLENGDVFEVKPGRFKVLE